MSLVRSVGAATGRQTIAIGSAMHSLERLMKQFKEQRLIDFLSSASWLPGYAFPQDIVKLVVRHVELTDLMRLERDREVGIAEYAPGAEIVADGYLLRSGANTSGSILASPKSAGIVVAQIYLPKDFHLLGISNTSYNLR